MEICTEVNVIPLNTNFSCYNVIDKATSVMSKNIETSINLCIRLKLNLQSNHKAPERKVQTSQLVRYHEEPILWKTARLKNP